MNWNEARHERERAANPDPHDVPGFDRATGIDDPVPDAEYGDVQGGPDRPEETGEECVELPIPDGAEYDVDDLEDGRIVVQWWRAEVDDHA